MRFLEGQGPTFRGRRSLIPSAGIFTTGLAFEGGFGDAFGTVSGLGGLFCGRIPFPGVDITTGFS